MSQPFSFPILENDELLQCLEEMEVRFDANQLAKPTYEAVRPLLEHIVITITGITREEMTQPVFTHMDVFEYPELHDESISTNNFFRQLSKLMLSCGVRDFSWRDVFKPEPVRLRRHLSGIINFAKFREDKALQFQELQGRLDGCVQATAALEEQHRLNVVELKRLQALVSEQALHVAEVEAQEAGVTAQNAALNKQAGALQAEARQLKQQANAKSDALTQARLDLSAAKQETEALQDQVVQSPDKHRQAIAELAAAADAKRVYGAQLTSQSIEKDRQLEMVAKFEKDLARCCKLLEELDGVIGKKKEVSLQVKDMRERITSNERALADATNMRSTLERHQATVLDKLQRLETQSNLKVEAASSAMEAALKDREVVVATNAAAAARAAEDQAVIRSFRERIQETQAAHDASVRGILDKQTALQAAVLEYNRHLEQALTASG